MRKITQQSVEKFMNAQDSNKLLLCVLLNEAISTSASVESCVKPNNFKFNLIFFLLDTF